MLVKFGKIKDEAQPLIPIIPVLRKAHQKKSALLQSKVNEFLLNPEFDAIEGCKLLDEIKLNLDLVLKLKLLNEIWSRLDERIIKNGVFNANDILMVQKFKEVIDSSSLEQLPAQLQVILSTCQEILNDNFELQQFLKERRECCWKAHLEFSDAQQQGYLMDERIIEVEHFEKVLFAKLKILTRFSVEQQNELNVLNNKMRALQLRARNHNQSVYPFFVFYALKKIVLDYNVAKSSVFNQSKSVLIQNIEQCLKDFDNNKINGEQFLNRVKPYFKQLEKLSIQDLKKGFFRTISFKEAENFHAKKVTVDFNKENPSAWQSLTKCFESEVGMSLHAAIQPGSQSGLRYIRPSVPLAQIEIFSELDDMQFFHNARETIKNIIKWVPPNHTNSKNIKLTLNLFLELIKQENVDQMQNWNLRYNNLNVYYNLDMESICFHISDHTGAAAIKRARELILQLIRYYYGCQERNMLNFFWDKISGHPAACFERTLRPLTLFDEIVAKSKNEEDYVLRQCHDSAVGFLLALRRPITLGEVLPLFWERLKDKRLSKMKFSSTGVIESDNEKTLSEADCQTWLGFNVSLDEEDMTTYLSQQERDSYQTVVVPGFY